MHTHHVEANTWKEINIATIPYVCMHDIQDMVVSVYTMKPKRNHVPYSYMLCFTIKTAIWQAS